MAKPRKGGWAEVVTSPYSNIFAGDKGIVHRAYKDPRPKGKKGFFVSIEKVWPPIVSEFAPERKIRTMWFDETHIKACSPPSEEELSKQLTNPNKRNAKK
jgi:hypothetical protein